MVSETLKLSKKLKGKLEIISKVKILSRRDLNLLSSPEPSREIARDHATAYEYTIKGNSVAVISDGSSIMGLGNLGAQAALPVMESMASMLKDFSGLDAFPLCIDTQEPRELIRCIRNLAPSFGAICLEDIAAPRCFIVENSLQDLGIPVFHNDQHGMAVTILAALMNASKSVNKELRTLKVVINGAGAGGYATAALLAPLVRDVLVLDRGGVLNDDRENLNEFKFQLSKMTNKDQQDGFLPEAIEGADAFIGISVGGILKPALIKKMARNPIVFALATPVPEIMQADAKKAGAAIVAGGQDFQNNISSMIACPGILRGALDARAEAVTHTMKMEAAKTIAAYVKTPSKDRILPDILDKKLPKAVAEAVKKAWK